MKKCILLFVILIAVLTLILVAFACQEDRAVETANADMGVWVSGMSALNGVVLPNSLGFDDFSGVQSTTFTSPSQFVGADPGLYAHNYTLNADSSVTINGTYQNYFIVFDLVNNDNSYCILSFSYTQASAFSHTIRLWSLNTNSQVLSTSQGGYNGVFSIKPGNFSSYSSLQLPTGKYVVYEEGANSYVINFYRIKLEKYSSLTNSSQGFSGFVVPNYTYQPEPSPYNSWDGVVYDNLLNNADLYQYPLYVDQNTISGVPNNMYYTDTTPSSLCYTTYYGYTVDNLPIFGVTDSRNNSLGVSNVFRLKYRFTYQDLYADIIGDNGYRYSPLFTFAFQGGASCTLTMTDDLGYTSSTAASGGNGVMPVSLSIAYPSGAAIPEWNYIDIVLEFSSSAGSTLNVELYYTKLEVSSLFTGFVPLDHSEGLVVGANYLYNYDFSDTIGINPINNAWYIADGYASFDTSGDGVLVSATSAVDLSYKVTTYIYASVGDPMVLSLQASTVEPFEVEVWGGAQSGTLLLRSYFLASSSTVKNNLVLPFSYNTNLVISLKFFGAGDYRLYHCKLEKGNDFTGYIPFDDGSFEQGANAVMGYNNGNVIIGTYYYFPNGIYDQDLSNGDSSEYGYTYYGSNDLDHSNSFGLNLYNGASGTYSSLTFTSFGLNVNNAANKVYVAFDFFSLNTVDFVIELNGDQYSYTLPSGSRLIYFGVDSISSLSVTNVSYSSSLYITKYKLEKSNYFTGFPADFDSNLDMADYYDIGYTNGYTAGTVDGENTGYANGNYDGQLEGYSRGKTDGITIGDAQGYERGLSIASNGSWRGLVSALIDVPVTTVVSFLDFDILGINMFGIFKTLVTLSLFFFIIKLLVGKFAG